MCGMLRRCYFVAPLLLIAFGCGGSSSNHALTPGLTFSADLTSQDSSLRTFNGGASTAGWNHLTGNTTIDGGAATVDMQATVTYTNGSGPFFGVITVTQSNGSTLMLRMNGQALKNQETGATNFHADLDVLGGTGINLLATGRGTFTGNRDGALGSPVSLNFKLNVQLATAG